MYTYTCTGFHAGFFLEGGRFFLYYVPLHSMLNSFIHMKVMQLLYTKFPVQLAWEGETVSGG